SDAGALGHGLLHLVAQERRDLVGLRRAGLPLDAGVDVFRVLAVDRDVQLAGALDRRGNALEPANGPHAGVEGELLPERDVDRTVAAADGRRERALDRDPVLPDRLERVLREPDRLLIDLV